MATVIVRAVVLAYGVFLSTFLAMATYSIASVIPAELSKGRFPFRFILSLAHK